MGKIGVFIIMLFGLASYGQSITEVDTVALKMKVIKEYEDIRGFSPIDEYYEFLEPAEVLYGLTGDNYNLAGSISKIYFELARKFGDKKKKTALSSQMDLAYLAPEKRLYYLDKAEEYLLAAGFVRNNEQSTIGSKDGFEKIDTLRKEIKKEL